MLQEFVALLFRYEHRIVLLIGNPSVAYLRRFITGSLMAFDMCGQKEASEAFEKFVPYMERFYHSVGTRGWDTLIAHNAKDDHDAISAFYSLLRSFLHEYYPEIICG